MGTTTSGLGAALSTMLTPLTAFAFLIFTLLYTPCVAAINAVRNEMGSVKSALGVVLYQCGFAWVAAFLVYHIGSIFIR
jgi:ferrous iron transport protein B